ADAAREAYLIKEFEYVNGQLAAGADTVAKGGRADAAVLALERLRDGAHLGHRFGQVEVVAAHLVEPAQSGAGGENLTNATLVEVFARRQVAHPRRLEGGRGDERLEPRP